MLVHGTTQSAPGPAPLVDARRPNGHRVVCLEVPNGTATTAAGYAELLAVQVPDDAEKPVAVSFKTSPRQRKITRPNKR